MYERAQYLPAGDKGLVVEFGDAISHDINQKVRSFTFALESAGLPGLVELVPTYRSLLVIYDPLAWQPGQLMDRLREIECGLPLVNLPAANVYHLPVTYGGELGPDLPFVCQHANLSPEDAIRIHTGVDYLVYMLGFTPGFTYLGGMDEMIATPRLATPRLKFPAGSVGIAGSQTGIYAVESPGGWQIIGRTPVKLFHPARDVPVLLSPGDYVRFFAVTPEEYREINRQVEAGVFTVKVSRKAKGG